MDGSGRATWTGFTHSDDYTTTSGALCTLPTLPVPQEAFVTKLNAAGPVLTYSTTGGSDGDHGEDIAVREGRGLVTGINFEHQSPADFPTTAAPSTAPTTAA